MKIYSDCTIELSSNPYKNYCSINGNDFELRYLNNDKETNKGGNSNIFLLYDLQNETEDFVIKFCKTNLFKKKGLSSSRAKRFRIEIAALKKARDKGLNKVINLISYGKKEFKDNKTKYNYKFYYHITEKAEFDLSDFMRNEEFEKDSQSKMQICYELWQSLKQLQMINIYHRDIKPENILMFDDGSWKLCDLGLIQFREFDFKLDSAKQIMGPKGWITPEAGNKYYDYCSNSRNQYSCYIDEKSDLFQLGQIFWFVFQSNIPLGVIKRDDFQSKDDNIFAMIIQMLKHNKNRRISMTNLDSEINVIKKKYAL